MKDRLEKYLLATDGHLGRTGKAMAHLSAKTGYSIAMLQSVAKGRRNFSDSAEKAVGKVLTKLEADLAKMPKYLR